MIFRAAELAPAIPMMILSGIISAISSMLKAATDLPFIVVALDQALRFQLPKASRTTLRLTPRLSASSSSTILWPETYSPAKMASRMAYTARRLALFVVWLLLPQLPQFLK